MLRVTPLPPDTARQGTKGLAYSRAASDFERGPSPLSFRRQASPDPMAQPSESTHPNRASFPSGMSGPSLRALSVAGIRSMNELEVWTEADLAALHGMGPKGIRILREALAVTGRTFRS